MKKILFVLFFSCFIITGCNSATIEKASTKLVNSKNYTARVKLNIDGNFNDEDINYERNKVAIIDNINGNSKVNSIVKLNDEKSNDTYYIKSVKDKYTLYKKHNDIYTKSDIEKDKNSLIYLSAFINENSAYQLKEKKDGKTWYAVTLKKDRVKDFLATYYDVSFLTNNEYDIVDDVRMNVYVNNKTKEIVSLDANFKDSIKFYNNDYINNFFLSINYSNYNNNTDVIINDDIINNSYDEKAIVYKEYSEDYVNAINERINSEDSINYNDNFEYKGITPNKVDLTIVAGSVVNGIIEVDNYLVKIESGIISIPTKIAD